MDFTKQNILMCEKAVEIHGLWEPEIGDYFFYVQGYGSKIPGDIGIIASFFKHKDRNNEIYITDCTNNAINMGKHRLLWLPRQDQLWKMRLDHNEDSKYDMFEFSYDCSKQCFQAQYRAFITHYPTDQWKAWCWLKEESKEEILLRYVMRENHSKTWDGKDWEPISFGEGK